MYSPRHFTPIFYFFYTDISAIFVTFRNPDHSQEYITQEDLERCIATENNVGMTPLHLACAVGNPDSVKQLLGIAQDAKSISVSKIINEPDNNGSLPITLAITSKNLEMVEILLESGAKVDEDTIFTAARSVQFAPFHFKSLNS